MTSSLLEKLGSVHFLAWFSYQNLLHRCLFRSDLELWLQVSTVTVLVSEASPSRPLCQGDWDGFSLSPGPPDHLNSATNPS